MVFDLIIFHSCRDTEPLVHRTKRAKAMVEGESAASAGQGGVLTDTIIISPQSSPLHEFEVRSPPASTGVDASSSGLDKEVGEGHQEEER